MTALSVILAVSAMLGAILTGIGRRGRRMDDHPLCRRCGFDLVALPADSHRCSECGSDLSRRNAMRIGTRVRRWGFVCAGVGLLIPGLLALVAVGVVGVAGIDVTQYEPVRFLLADPDLVRSGRFAEIDRRLRAGTLSPGDVSRVAQWILARQKRDRWQTTFGDWMETAMVQGVLPQPLWDAYLSNALIVRLEVRPRMRAGDPFVCRLSTTELRGSGNSSAIAGFPFSVIYSTNLWIDGARVTGTPSPGRVDPFTGVGQWPMRVPALAPGPHRTRVEIAATIIPNVPLAVRAGGFTGSAEAVFEITPGPSVAGTVTDLHRMEVRSSVKLQSVYRGASYGLRSFDSLSVDLILEPSPVPVCADVIARASNGDEWLLGQILSPEGGGRVVSQTGSVAGLGERTIVDIVLRPNRQQAASTFGVTEIWGEEIVFPNIQPTALPRPASVPTRRSPRPPARLAPAAR